MYLNNYQSVLSAAFYFCAKSNSHILDIFMTINVIHNLAC